MLRVTVDGRRFDHPGGLTILEALEHIGVEVPALCHDPRFAPQGACRLCVVAVDGLDRPVPACTTPLRDAMVIETHPPAIESVRRTLLAMLADAYPSAARAGTSPEPFHALLLRYGLPAATAGRHDAALVDGSHATIQVDLNRCISCWRCVRICDEVQGQFVWRITGRGVSTRIVPDSGTSLAASSCVACGACVDTCPTGALEDKTVLAVGHPAAWTRTTCPYCGVGCEMMVGTVAGGVAQVLPAHDAPVNRGHLCVKGRYGFGFASAPDRVTEPMVRTGASWRTVSWEEAIGVVAGQLRRILDRYGPTAVGLLGSARATNEDNYLAQKLARAVLRTNNVDCCARVCHAPSAAALRLMLGTGAATSSFDDIERARAILLVGTNTTENHPVVGARIKQAHRRGARLVVVDSRRIELADHADVHLQVRPGTNVLVLNAMAHTIVQEGLVDEEFVAQRVDGRAAFERHIDRFAPEAVAAGCGVDAASIREAARAYATAGPAIAFHGLGLTEHRQGTEGVMCLVNLALLTGNLGRPGAGVNPLRGQNNVQGAAHMGCEPAHLPGYAPLADARERVGAIWGVDVPQTPGLDAMEMLDAAQSGELKALWVVGWDILLTQPNTSATDRALANLELLVVQDLFLNETARQRASVLLPAASTFEKDGTFMNAERRVQRVRKVNEAPGQAKPDWEIFCLAAGALGHAELFTYRDAERIWDEIRGVWPAGAGISYRRLDSGGLQWPCPDEAHPGTTLLHTDTFPGIGRRTPLRPIEFEPSAEQADAEFPFVLVTGRNLYQFNAATMTARSATAQLRPSDTLELTPDDAARLGVGDGDAVRVVSRWGDTVLPAEVTTRVPPGVVFATFSDPTVAINRVTGTGRDPYTHTPEYKVTAVRLQRQGLASVS